MKDFDISKLLKDPSKIELDPTSPLTLALAAAAFLVLILLATILFFVIRGIRRSMEARGQRKAMQRAEARNLARRSESPIDSVVEPAAVRAPLVDPDEPKSWPLEPFGAQTIETSSDGVGPAQA